MSGTPVASVGSGERAAIQTLSSTPPEEWGDLLEVLGASFLPVNYRKVEEAPCTITSLLSMMGQGGDATEMEQQAQAEEEQGSANTPCTITSLLNTAQTQPTQSLHNQASNAQALRMTGNTQRPRTLRVQQRGAARPNITPEEDTRDLEALLRDLGEATTAGQSKAKRKAKAASKKTKESSNYTVNELPIASETQSSATETLDSQVEDTPEPEAAKSVKASKVEMSEARLEAASEHEAAVNDDGMQVVVSKAARRACRRTQVASESNVPPEPSSSMASRAARDEEAQNDHVKESRVALCAQPADPVVDNAAPSVAQPDPASVTMPEAAVAACAEDMDLQPIRELHSCIPAESSCTAASVVVDERESVTSPKMEVKLRDEDLPLATPASDAHDPPSPSMLVRSKSDGSLPDAFCAAQMEDTLDSRVYHTTPSVGTWLRRPTTPRPAPFGVQCFSDRDRFAQAEVIPHETIEHNQPWHGRPSVGTWLRASSRSSRAPSQDVQLWPATPESTPPMSPRCSSGSQQVVWVPVPLHLLNEVQQVLQQGASYRAA